MIEGIKGKNSYFVPTGNPFVDGGIENAQKDNK